MAKINDIKLSKARDDGKSEIIGVSGKFMWIRRVKVVPLSHE